MTDSTATPSQWTDDQETALLKTIMKYKPVGMHKHFRMLSIRDALLQSGVINPDDEHTRIPGIWAKLETLYDLSTLDEREDSIMNDAVDEDGDVTEYWRNFELPERQFGNLMDEKRLDPDGSDSEDELRLSRRESTVADTDEPRSSPITGSVSGRSQRAGMRASARKSRTSKLKDEIEMEGSRRTSKAGSIAELDDETMGEEEDERESEEVSEEDDERASGRRGGRGAKKTAATRGTAKRGRRR